MKNYLIMVLICFLFIFAGCERADYNTHVELSPDSPQVVTFNYKMYKAEAPPKDVLSYFEFQIELVENIYVGDDAFIKFENNQGFIINEDPINFVFEEKTERLMVQITPNDLSKPLELPFEGKIISRDGNEVEFFGSLLINREQG